MKEKKKKNILFILPTLNAGGAENYALRFIHYCGHDEFRWFVLTPHLKKGHLDSQFEDVCKKVIYQRISYFNPIQFFKLYRFLKKHQIDAVCTFNGNFGGIPLTIARFAGIKIRIALHRRSTNAFGNNPFKLAYNFLANKLIMWNANKILSNSLFALESFYGSYWKNDSRFKVIPNGVDGKQFDSGFTTNEAKTKLGLDPKTFVIGHVGRFDPSKNHETIFRVASKLKEFESNFTFLFCGNGTDENEFKSEIHRHGIEDICLTLGTRDDLPIVYRAMDIMYFPSKTEGQPNALIEAMLSGTSVLPSNIPPILEILPDNSHQNTVDAFNEEEAVLRIKNIILGKEKSEDLIYYEWAKKNFDLKENLQKFKNELSYE